MNNISKLEEIKKNENGRTNYFVCLTPLHYFFSYSIAWSLYEENRTNSVIIIKGNFKYKNQTPFPFMKIINIKNASFFEKVICYLRYNCFFKRTTLYKVIKKELAELYVFNFNDPLTKNMIKNADSKVKITYVEEGTGSWNRSWSGAKPPEKVSYALMGEAEMFESTHPEFHGKIIKLDYKAIFNEKRSKEFCWLSIDIPKVYNMDYLYLGICDNEWVESNKEMQILKTILEIIPKDKDIYIKKHPRDTSNKYYDLENIYSNVKIMDKEMNKIPMECLVWVHHIDTIISIMSSAGIYVSYINKNIKSILLYKLHLVTESNLISSGIFTESEMDLFTSYINRNKLICCPKDLFELKKCLCD